jgi:hypothetical protein
MPAGSKKKRKKPSRKKSELDSALDQIGDESAAAAMKALLMRKQECALQRG